MILACPPTCPRARYLARSMVKASSDGASAGRHKIAMAASDRTRPFFSAYHRVRREKILYDCDSPGTPRSGRTQQIFHTGYVGSDVAWNNGEADGNSSGKTPQTISLLRTLAKNSEKGILNCCHSGPLASLTNTAQSFGSPAVIQ